MSYPKLTPIIAKGAIEPRYLEDKFADKITPIDFGAKGDGTTDDTAVFTALETAYPDALVDLLGKTYKVSTVPSGAKYFNGSFLKSSDNYNYRAEYGLVRQGEFGISIGKDAGASVNSNRWSTDLIAIGEDAGKNVTTGRNCIAIGRKALSGPAPGRHNIAIGVESLACIESPEPSNSDNMSGTRNICVGGNTGHFITTGNRNIIIGRDAGHAVTTGTQNIVIGNSAWICECPNSPEPDTVINQFPRTQNGNILIGVSAGANSKVNYAVGIGYNALLYTKGGNGVVAIGSEAGSKLDSDVSSFGTQQTIVDINGTYSQDNSSSILITTESSHGLNAGHYVQLRFTSGTMSSTSAADDIWFNVDTVPSETTFTISTYPANGTTKTIPVGTSSGNVTLKKTANTTSKSSGVEDTVLIGRLAGAGGTSASRLTAVGSAAGNKCGASGTFVGAGAGNVTTGSRCTFVGDRSGISNTTGAENTAIGASSLRYATTGNANVALGVNALSLDTDGNSFNYSECVGLGNNTRASGDNQVQLGNGNQTPYAYAALQVRSDARDKTDVRDTVLGLDFIKAIRPVDFRWDYRDDYVEVVEDGVNKDGNALSHVVHHEKDGSHKRNRYHHGLIAQEVKAVLDEKGIDFGGYQDHKINGGKDVLTLGYEEFIGPLIKSVQELNSKIEQLEEQIHQLTNSNN